MSFFRSFKITLIFFIIFSVQVYADPNETVVLSKKDEQRLVECVDASLKLDDQGSESESPKTRTIKNEHNRVDLGDSDYVLELEGNALLLGKSEPGKAHESPFLPIPKDIKLRPGAVAIPVLNIPEAKRTLSNIVERAKKSKMALRVVDKKTGKIGIVKTGEMGEYDRYVIGDNARKTRDQFGNPIDIHVPGFEFNEAKLNMNYKLGLPGEIDHFEIVDAHKIFKEVFDAQLKQITKVEVAQLLKEAQKTKKPGEELTEQEIKDIWKKARDKASEKARKIAGPIAGDYVLKEAGYEPASRKEFKNPIPGARASEHTYLAMGGVNVVFVTQTVSFTTQKPHDFTRQIPSMPVVRKVMIPSAELTASKSQQELVGKMITYQVEALQLTNELCKAATFNGKRFIRATELNVNNPEALKRGILETEFIGRSGKDTSEKSLPDSYDIAVNIRKREMGLCDSGCESFFKKYPYESFPIEMRGKILPDGQYEQGPLLRAASEFYYVKEKYIAALKESNTELTDWNLANNILSIPEGSSTPEHVAVSEIMGDSNRGENMKWSYEENMFIINDI